MFKHEYLRTRVKTSQEQVLDFVADCSTTDHKGVKLAAATVLLNFSVLHQGAGRAPDLKNQSLSILNEILTSSKVEASPDLFLRALISIGTFIHGDKEATNLVKNVLEMSALIQPALLSADPDVKPCATLLLRAINS